MISGQVIEPLRIPTRPCRFLAHFGDHCPTAEELTFKNRRFSPGSGVTPSAGQKVFTAAELGLTVSWGAVFPLGHDRCPRKGSGLRFVHGGTSLQEVVVPVIRPRKERKDQSPPVEAELLRLPAKIITSRLSFGLFQLEPADPADACRCSCASPWWPWPMGPCCANPAPCSSIQPPAKPANGSSG